MGLFEKVYALHEENQIKLNKAEAFAAITLIAVSADGYVTDTEAQAVGMTLARMKLFNSYSREAMGEMIDRLQDIKQQQGVKPLLSAAIAVLPYELQETVFAVVTDIVLVDGEVTEEEDTFLNNLHHALEIPEDTVVKIVDVILIKNRG